MAKPKKPADTERGVKIADNILTDLEANEVFDPEIAAIEQVIRQYGDIGGRVTVYKQGPGGYRDITYLFACPPSEWLEDGPPRLQRDYGKGIYRIHIQDNTGAFIVNKAIPVEALPQSKTAAPAPAQTSDAPVAAALEMMARSIAGMMEAVKLATQPNPGGNLAQLKELAGLVKEMMPAPASGGGFEQTLAAAGSLMGLLKQFGDVGRLREKEIPTDEDGKADVGSAALMKGLNLLEEAMRRSMSQGSQPGVNGAEHTLPAPSAAVAAPEVISTGEKEPDVNELEFAALKVQVMLANKAAHGGIAPEAFAEEKYESIPDELLQMVAFDPKWFEYLAQAVPECVQLKLWWDKVRDKLVDLGVEDEYFTRNADGTLVLTPDSESVTVAANGPSVAGSTDGNSGSTH